MDPFNGNTAWYTPVLYITLKDNETFLSNPYVYNQLMTKRVPHVTFVLSTWRGNVNDLEDPFLVLLIHSPFFITRMLKSLRMMTGSGFIISCLCMEELTLRKCVLNMMTDYLSFTKFTRCYLSLCFPNCFIVRFFMLCHFFNQHVCPSISWF
jgi:hypothetical protein